VTDPRLTPNHIRIDMGLSGGAWFGQLHCVSPGSFDGDTSRIHIAFCHGLSMDITRADAMRLLKELPAALKHLPAQLPYGDYSGIAAHMEDQP